VSHLLATLGRPVMIDANDGRADETRRPAGGSVRSNSPPSTRAGQGAVSEPGFPLMASNWDVAEYFL
jgi:hypothetical protein